MHRGLRARVRAGEPTLGSWITLAHPAVAEIMARAGFDWLVVDLEHSAITIEGAADLIRAIDAAGCAPLVRLSDHDPTGIKRVMDAGAHGVVLPMASSAEAVDAAYRALHYPPTGTRGVGLSRAQAYGVDFDGYREWLASEALLVAQIEHADALRDLDALMGNDAMDAFLVGPYDLSASLGHPGDFEHPAYRDALAAILAAGEAANRTAGIHVVEPDPPALRTRQAEGYRFCAYGVDFRMLDVACRQGVQAARG